MVSDSIPENEYRIWRMRTYLEERTVMALSLNEALNKIAAISFDRLEAEYLEDSEVYDTEHLEKHRCEECGRYIVSESLTESIICRLCAESCNVKNNNRGVENENTENL